MQPDAIAAASLAILAIGCGAVLLGMMIADRVAERRKPRKPPTVPMNQRLPPA